MNIISVDALDEIPLLLQSLYFLINVIDLVYYALMPEKSNLAAANRDTVSVFHVKNEKFNCTIPGTVKYIIRQVIPVVWKRVINNGYRKGSKIVISGGRARLPGIAPDAGEIPGIQRQVQW